MNFQPPNSLALLAVILHLNVWSLYLEIALSILVVYLSIEDFSDKILKQTATAFCTWLNHAKPVLAFPKDSKNINVKMQCHVALSK